MSNIGSRTSCTTGTTGTTAATAAVLGYSYASNIELEESTVQVSFGLTTGSFTELRTTSFIESTGDACSDSVSHNRVQVLSISALLIASSQD